eukprot:COSAG01_NODE_6291_length_3751_cov_1.987678_1_plen_118_part_00
MQRGDKAVPAAAPLLPSLSLSLSFPLPLTPTCLCVGCRRCAEQCPPPLPEAVAVAPEALLPVEIGPATLAKRGFYGGDPLCQLRGGEAIQPAHDDSEVVAGVRATTKPEGAFPPSTS